MDISQKNSQKILQGVPSEVSPIDFSSILPVIALDFFRLSFRHSFRVFFFKNYFILFLQKLLQDQFLSIFHVTFQVFFSMKLFSGSPKRSSMFFFLLDFPQTFLKVYQFLQKSYEIFFLIIPLYTSPGVNPRIPSKNLMGSPWNLLRNFISIFVRVYWVFRNPSKKFSNISSRSLSVHQEAYSSVFSGILLGIILDIHPEISPQITSGIDSGYFLQGFIQKMLKNLFEEF